MDPTVSVCSCLFHYLFIHFCFFAAHTDYFSSSLSSCLFALIGVLLLCLGASRQVLSLFVVLFFLYACAHISMQASVTVITPLFVDKDYAMAHF